MECPVCYSDNCALTLTCGHAMCKSCIKNWYITSHEPDCPMCRAPLNFRGLHRVREKWEEEAYEKKIEEHMARAIDNAIDEWIEDIPAICIHAIAAVEHNFNQIKHIFRALPDDAIELFLDCNNIVSFPAKKYIKWDDFLTRRYPPSKHKPARIGRLRNIACLM